MTAHERFRVFDTDQWYRGQQKLGSRLAMVVRAGRWLAIRGQTGHDLKGAFHGRGDVACQAGQAMKNLGTLLAEAGGSLEDVCKVRLWVRDRAFIEPASGVLGAHLRGIPIILDTAVISAFARPWLDMEIDVWAVLQDRKTGTVEENVSVVRQRTDSGTSAPAVS